jgi:hypothetical protein
VLLLEAGEDTVSITGRVLDKGNNNALLWEKTVVDTMNADALVTGPASDQPKEPFITKGYFTLYLYQDYSATAIEDPYYVYYDNAVAIAPPVAANTAPSISEIQPDPFRNFLPQSSSISFKVSDDKPLADDKIALTLNGTKYTIANGLTLSAAGAERTATLSGKLTGNVNYQALIEVEDSEGLKASQTFYFDTFSPENLVIEVEDYNFSSGAFFDNPIVIPEDTGPQDNAYMDQTGTPQVDYNDTRTDFRDVPYRPNDNVRMQHSLDMPRQKFVEAGGPDAGIFDYDVGDTVGGEWLNYTRTFDPGSYEVYLREYIVNIPNAESVLELVTSDPTIADQTTKPLGSFLGVRSGFSYRNVPLTDGSGANKVILRVSGKTTLRLRQVTTDPDGAYVAQNYLVFVQVPDPGLQRAAITSISPTPNSETQTVYPAIRVEIQNRDTSIKADTIKLQLNGETLTPTITADANGAVVTYALAKLPAPGALNTARISFLDNLNVEVSSEWSFKIDYIALDPANRASGTGAQSGFRIRVVQAPAGSNLPNTIERAEQQLAPNSPFTATVDVTETTALINYDKKGIDSGFFPGDQPVPGINFDENGWDDFAVEILTYLDLSAGPHEIGVNMDDGYKLTSGATLGDLGGTLLGLHTGGATHEERIQFVAPAAGLYPFRLVWYERGGDGYAEWFSIDPGSGDRILINDPDASNSIKAYITLQGPSLQVQSAAVVNGPYAADTTAVIDLTSSTITIPLPTDGKNHFYRLAGGAVQKITSSSITGGNLVLKYAPAP